MADQKNRNSVSSLEVVYGTRGCPGGRAAVDMTALPPGVDGRGGQSSKQLQATLQNENANRKIEVREVAEDAVRPSQSGEMDEPR